MATPVMIQVVVDPTDSAAKINTVSAEVAGIGTASTGAAAKVGQSMHQMGGHVATGLDSVRLLSQEFGLRMPRAIEMMLSRMPGLVSALSSVIGLMGGIAAVEIFSRAIEGGYKMYEQYISLNAAADKFYDTLKKTSEQDITNTRSLETTRDREGRATSASTGNQKFARATGPAAWSSLMQGDFIGAAVDFAGAHNAMESGIKSQEQSIQLTRVQIDQEHQMAALKIEQQHASDALLTGAQKNNAEAAKKIAVDAEQRKYDNRVERFYGNAVPQDAGSEEQSVKDQTALAEAAAQNTRLGRESSLAIMKANDQRVQAGLQGEALYFRKMQDDIHELTAELQLQGKAAEIPARVREINEKYFNDLGERVVKAQNASGQSIRRSQSAGLTGAARIYADQDYQVNDNNTKLSGDERGAANEAAKREANQKLIELQTQFVDSMDAIGEQWVDSTLGGYARIDAEATKAAHDIADKFNKAWGGSDVDQSSAQYLAAKQAEQDALTNVQHSAALKRSELAQANHADDLRYDQQAADAEKRVKENGALGWIAANRDAMAEIDAQEKARLASLDKDYAKGLVSWSSYQQRTVDVEREAAAEIQQQQQAMSQKLSGLFESAFNDPIGTIKSTMEKLMFDLLAQWVLHFKMVQQLLGGSLSGGKLGGGGGVQQLGGTIAHALGAGSGSTSQIAAQDSGASSSASGASYRPAYAGGGASGPISSAGIISGAASPSSVGAGITGVKDIAGLTGIGQADSSSGGGVVFDDQGNATLTDTIADPSAGSGMSTALGALGAAGAAYSAEQTTVSAFDQGSAGGVMSGTLGDAAAGAVIGSVIPGIGTAVGAAVGAAVGFASGLAGAVLGMGGRIAARDYYEKTLFPQIEADRNGQGGDGMSAISDVNRTAIEGYIYMSNHFGAQGATWVKQNYMDKEVARAVAEITRHASGGQQYTQRQAMQFHSGGYISDFGDFGTSGAQGMIHALMGETVMHQSATATHAPVLNAMNDGASPADIASMYLASSRSSSTAAAAPSGGDQHIHVHAWDTDSVTKWLRSGGSRTIAKAQNDLAAQYSGDGVIG